MSNRSRLDSLTIYKYWAMCFGAMSSPRDRKHPPNNVRKISPHPKTQNAAI